ncbi:MAG: glycosyltransferase family 9 protein [Desulfonatronovibrionaceae bacterium]
MSNTKNALIINLTRFGDLLQSQPVLSGLKDQGFINHLICLENFLSAARLLEHAHEIHALPGAKFLALLDSSWPDAVAAFSQWLDSALSTRSFDLLVNLTPSLSARLLASRIKAREFRGFFLDEMGFGRYSGNWAAYLQASSGHRGSSPFNIVDIFLKTADLEPSGSGLSVTEPDPETWQIIGAKLADFAPASSLEGFAAFQMGASQDKRRWPLEYFVRLGDLLYQELKICPVLLGTEQEKGLAARYQSRALGPAIDLSGQTSLPELEAVLQHCQVLVTNDTGTMHLASALQVRCAAFFLATAQPWDTGPYLDNCLCLEPGMDCHPCSFSHECTREFACRWSITPETVFQALKNFLTCGIWPGIQTRQARMHKTGFHRGFYTLSPLNQAAEHNYSRWMAVQKYYYSLFLDNLPIESPDHLKKPDQAYCQKIVQHLQTVLPVLNLAVAQGRALKKTAAPPVKNKFISTWQRLSSQLSSSPWMPVLGLLWTYQSQSVSRNLDQVIELCQSYQKLLTAIAAFLQSDRLCANLDKPCQ